MPTLPLVDDADRSAWTEPGAELVAPGIHRIPLPVGAGGRLTAGDPEDRLLGPVADGHPEVHESPVPEGTEDRVVERARALHVRNIDAEVIDHVLDARPGH